MAVVGMAVLLPGAPNVEAYWRNLTGGVDSVTDLPPDYGLSAEEFPGGRGGFLGDLATVDIRRMGVMPSAVAGTEPDQLIALHVASAAVADAGGEKALMDPDRVGVILGRGGYLTAGLARIDLRARVARQLVHTLGELLPDLDQHELDRVRSAFVDKLGPESPGSQIGLVPNLAASRVANRLGFGGPAYTVDAACASSLIAVDHAIGELGSGRCDAVLAGGVHHGHDATLWSVFASLGALSPTAAIRPFDRDADGLLIGEGTAIVVLKRLDDAHKAGDRVYAVIRGTGVASDGGGVSLMHPATKGQVLAVRRAWEAAGLDPAAPDSVGLIEAHGTATPAGDAAELATLREVFGAPEGHRPAVIGSVKSMIGHTMPAAGVAGLVKAALAVYHGVLPPTLHCENPHPALAETRFRPVADARPWTGPRRAAVNAFGFGGISAHVILEQDSRPRAVVREPVRVLRLTAESPARLAELLDTGVSTVDGARLAVVEPTERKLAIARRVLAAGVPWRGRNDIWFSPRPLLAQSGHRLAFVHPGLEADFAPQVDDVADYFGMTPPDLSAHNIGRHGSAVVAVGRLLDAAMRRLGVEPDAVAGHSIGEWTAMITSGMYDEAELDRVLTTYALDSFQVPDLVFAAIGAGADLVEPELARYDEITLSHDNSPNQCIVCGPIDQVTALLADLLDERVIGQILPFRSGFHTPRLAPYLDQIQRDSDRLPLRPPSVPIWSATIAAPYPADLDEVRALFYRHLVEPVRFRPLIERMYADGVRAFVQLGPGQLGTLIGDVLRDKDHLVIAANSTKHGGLGQLARVTAALWAEGREVRDELLTPRIAPGPQHLVRLDLGGPLVSLGADASRLINRTSRRVEADIPVLAGFEALLRDSEQAALDVIAAAVPRRETGVVREMSLRAMPHLRDHAFFQVPRDWPDDFDRFPVVPATELVRQMMEAAGGLPVAVHDARFERWVAVEPAVRATFDVTPEGPSRVRVAVRGYAQATVRKASAYSEPPPRWTGPWADERVPLLTARELYARRWMFHGPAYQGVTEITAIGERHVRGVITTPAAPGGLLDNAGHFVGYWILETFERNSRVFPVRFREIRFFADHPPAGERIECVVRIVAVTDSAVTADIQLVRADGTVWATADGWQVHRFSSDERLRALERSCGTELLAERQDGDCFLVTEAWPDLASREIMARHYLGAQEWARYEARPPRERRQWLLGRMAVKDAVRQHLWDNGCGPVFPVELVVSDDWVVTGRHGRIVPDLDVAVAGEGAVAVAIVRPRTAAGVRIELVDGQVSYQVGLREGAR
ncbi:MAG: polyketide synthase dehydratase domain-containing protein [Actinomycetota bacterium]|nr:polyketide synthase dehydratase domain-containing protein [Actinomycetota bacterium]